MSSSKKVTGSVAAYYLKSTHTSFDNYLESLKKHDDNFVSAQENVLKDLGTYIKTRYDIVTLSLRQLITINEDFSELLLFISLLDSQNIPRKLLEKYKSKSVVDGFIYNLKKYSLITNVPQTSMPQEINFSIHRSTQQIFLEYLTKKLKLGENPALVKSMSNKLRQYVLDAIETKNYHEVESLIGHCKIFLHHKLLSNANKGTISRSLGHLYTYLGHHLKAQQFFQESLDHLKQTEHYDQLFHTVICLGNIYRELGHYAQAKKLLEDSLKTYKSSLAETNMSIPQLLFYLGNVYRELGDYEKAKTLLEESLTLYNKHHSDKHLKRAWVLIHLGTVYRQLGDYTQAKIFLEEGHRIYMAQLPNNHPYLIGPLLFLSNLFEDIGDYKKAKELLETCYRIQTVHHSKNHISAAWICANLGNVYRKLGDYEKAKKFSTYSLYLYKKHLPENNLYLNWVTLIVGNVHKDAGEYEKAKEILEKNLKSYEHYFSEGHIETARVLSSLGQLYAVEDRIEEAEHCFQKALKNFQHANHPDIYMIFEDLAELYQKKSEHAKKANQLSQAQEFRNIRVDYLEKSLDTLKTHFPASSPHLQRIQLKLAR